VRTEARHGNSREPAHRTERSASRHTHPHTSKRSSRFGNEDVLAVPVAALLALPKGGFGVQVVDGDTTRIVAVKTGMFAAGQVEVSGRDVAEGVTVGVPK